ncbi:hypothetical protein QQP08_000938, partial [Theobroma cacao]
MYRRAYKEIYLGARRDMTKGLDETSEWKNQWQSQLTELNRRRLKKDFIKNMSWVVRTRRQ